MKLFSYQLSSTLYISGKPGITLIQVDIFANSNEEADNLLRDQFNIVVWNIDSVEEN